jgi:hypothetical protein
VHLGFAVLLSVARFVFLGKSCLCAESPARFLAAIGKKLTAVEVAITARA